MSEPSTVFSQETHWEVYGSHRIPFVADTGNELYKRELECFFYKDHRCCVGLEAEIPTPGDYKRTVRRRALGRHGA